MIDADRIPRLRERWARAEAAFRDDPLYVVEMAEDAAKVHAKRMAERERDEVVAIARAERQAVRQAARNQRLEARRAQARESADQRREEARQREEERQAQRDAMRALVPDSAGLSDAVLRYRARMAAMTPDEQKAFHKAKNEAYAAKRTEESAREGRTPEQVMEEGRRERRRAQERARRAVITPEQRRAKDRAKNERRVAHMSPEERAAFYRAANVKAWANRKTERQGNVGGTP
ncbi:hypothetical protein AB1K56_17260 [Microbacterium sp. BWR-S6Y]|uniref:hypothetical protein n=1 Tax=Microbacterium sp. BWR-S6Y TaxID=3232073 RepID=UPI003528877D